MAAVRNRDASPGRRVSPGIAVPTARSAQAASDDGSHVSFAGWLGGPFGEGQRCCSQALQQAVTCYSESGGCATSLGCHRAERLSAARVPARLDSRGGVGTVVGEDRPPARERTVLLGETAQLRVVEIDTGHAVSPSG